MFTDGACRGNPGPGGWGVVDPSRGSPVSLPRRRTRAGTIQCWACDLRAMRPSGSGRLLGERTMRRRANSLRSRSLA